MSMPMAGQEMQLKCDNEFYVFEDVYYLICDWDDSEIRLLMST